MEKVFEDYFSELQTDMVAICMEYSEHKVDDIYIYCSYELNMYAFDVFFKAQDMVVHTHKLNEIYPEIDTSIERQKAMINIGNQNLKLRSEEQTSELHPDGQTVIHTLLKSE